MNKDKQKLYSKTQNRNIDISSEIAELCLDPGYLAEWLSTASFEKTKDTSGHIHFYFRNKSDHIVFVWSEGKLKKLAAKSPGCKKGQYVHWKDSQFRDYNRDDILGKLYKEIECIEIDGDNFSKTWPSFNEFIEWLLAVDINLYQQISKET